MEQFCVFFFITEGNFFFDKPDLKKKHIQYFSKRILCITVVKLTSYFQRWSKD